MLCYAMLQVVLSATLAADSADTIGASRRPTHVADAVGAPPVEDAVGAPAEDAPVRGRVDARGGALLSCTHDASTPSPPRAADAAAAPRPKEAERAAAAEPPSSHPPVTEV